MDLKRENEKLLAKRREVRANLPRRPDLAKALRPQEGSEKPLPPRSESQVWAAHDPFEPMNLGSNLAKWESFNWDRHPKLRPAKKIIVDWYNGLPDSGALVLAGDVGCGKTHLADAIADLYGRWRLSFYEEIELITKIQETYSDKAKSQERVFNDLFRPSLLILDDLGTYETTNWSFLSNVYNRIFNDYLTVKRKPILITTNIPMYLYDDKGNIIPGGMAERIGARSFSRLCDALGKLSEGRYIDLFGIEDMRIEGYLG